MLPEGFGESSAPRIDIAAEHGPCPVARYHPDGASSVTYVPNYIGGVLMWGIEIEFS